MLARVRQFREASAGPAQQDFDLAEQHLSDSLFQLFLEQDPRDIRHAALTTRWLIERGQTDTELIQAALLHDVGKGRQRRWDRVAYVVCDWLGVRRQMASERSRFELRRAIYRSLKHAAFGAAVLTEAGASERVVELTRLHHVARPRDAMLRRLNEADAAS